MSLLELKDLKVRYNTPEGVVRAVDGVSFAIDRSETLAIVGESGSGKSQSCFAAMGLLPKNAEVSGSIKYQGEEIIGASEALLNKLRANEMAMIFQDPMTSLNPYMRISTQMSEVLRFHPVMGKKLSGREAHQACIDMLDAVKIPDAKNRIKSFPHEFSGGMRQRVMIAMALLCKPQLLIADEPTTALDVTVQARIMDLLMELQRDLKMAIILITHNLGLVAGSCARTLVMNHGKILEAGETTAIFSNPQHAYTQHLLDSMPRLHPKKSAPTMSSIRDDAAPTPLGEASR
ncbi:ABC transporter ATP-binding protein [Polycladidibacter stylochi]|uniref:ABC transporter ATP-binding protein n=1 Tax=Polycladidibacter stylochi TaxID=1807766 RepID=UPI0008372DED|nr:ABC transporter ATP-binding protein [Pseudovibrio stylochi]